MAKTRGSAASAMIPPDAVERIRASNRAWHGGDLDGAVAAYSDGIEWDTRDAFPDGRVYKGRDAFRAYCEEVLARWGDEHRLEIEEILGVEGTATVVVRFRMTGRSQSGVPIDTPWVHVLDFDRGEIVRARNFGSFDAAMESVGPARLSPLWERAPAFYYDISSPYAYLAAERMGTVLPEADWRPILIGGLFKLNGRTSWIFSDERESRMAEIEERAKRYGLPPITWPTGLPENQLGLARAATVAKRHGQAARFAIEGFRATYARGVDPSTDQALRELAAAVDLDGDELIAAIAEHDLKDELRRTTERAHEQGVPGVPTVVVDDVVFWGDDRLDEAAAAARPS